MSPPDDPDELVHTSGALPRKGDGSKPLFRTVHELEERSMLQQARVARRAPGGDHPTKIRSILPDVDEQTREVESLGAIRPRGEPAKPQPVHLDLEGYLADQHSKIIGRAFEDALMTSEDFALRAQMEWEENDWELAKKDLSRRSSAWVQSGSGSSVVSSGVGLLSSGTGPALAPLLDMEVAESKEGPITTTRAQNIEGAYAEMVGKLTSGRTDIQQFISRFLEVALALSSNRDTRSVESEEFREVLNFLQVMLEIDHGRPRLPGEPVDRTTCLRFLRQGAMAALEQEFKHWIIDKTKVQFEQGSIPCRHPGYLGNVEGYMEWQGKSGALPHGSPVYRRIYYFLRSGARQEAYEVVRNSTREVHEVIREALRVLLDDQRTGGGNNVARRAVFNNVRQLKEQQMMDQSEPQDPFEEMVFNLLSFANPNRFDKEQVVRTTEDYIWFTLWFTQYDDVQIEDLAKKILRWGPAHFDPQGRKPLVYARVLFCYQLFREGVYYLQSMGKYLEATHLAIIFDRFRIFDDLTRPPEVDPSPINFESVLTEYTSSFSTDYPSDAADYLLLLRPPDRMEVALIELLCRTRRHAELAEHLLNKTYTYTWEGADYRWDKDYAREVVRKAAAYAERQARPKLAIDLYRLSGDYVEAVRVLNCQLCSALLTTRNGREDWVNGAKAFHGLREQQPALFTDPPAVHAMEDLKALLHLVTFFDLVAEGRFEEAHKVVYDTLGLFPCSDEMVQEKVAKFRGFPEPLQLAFSDVVATTMQCLYKLYQEKRRTGVESRAAVRGWPNGPQEEAVRGVEHSVRTYSGKARLLLSFAVEVRRYLSDETMARLERLERAMLLWEA